MFQSQTISIIILIIFMVFAFMYIHHNNNKKEREKGKNIEKMENCQHEKTCIKGTDDSERDDLYTLVREGGKISQVDDDKIPYYHIANELVTNNNINKKKNKCLRKKRKNKKIVFPDFYDGKVECSRNKKREVCDNETFNFKPDCDWDIEENMMKKYLIEKVLNCHNQYPCNYDEFSENKKTFTNDDIDEYREKHIITKDFFNGTSKDYFDPVDKMNEISIVGVCDNGMTIADCYDSVVSNKYDVQRMNSTCTINPKPYLGDCF